MPILVTQRQIARQTGARLHIIPLLESGELDMQAYQAMLSARTRMVAIVHVSNVLGTVNPVADVVRLAKQAGALTLIDGAQAVAHAPVDVQALGCDFYPFPVIRSMARPGLACYMVGKKFTSLAAWQFGGEMIRKVTFTESEFGLPPLRFEGNSGDCRSSRFCLPALDFPVRRAALAAGAEAYQQAVVATPAAGFTTNRRYMWSDNRPPVRAWCLWCWRMHIIMMSASYWMHRGSPCRSGHHCAMPLLHSLGLAGTLRISLGVYNNETEIDAFLQALRQALELLHD